jgi:hypothetical protein
MNVSVNVSEMSISFGQSVNGVDRCFQTLKLRGLELKFGGFRLVSKIS